MPVKVFCAQSLGGIAQAVVPVVSAAEPQTNLAELHVQLIVNDHDVSRGVFYIILYICYYSSRKIHDCTLFLHNHFTLRYVVFGVYSTDLLITCKLSINK